MDRELSIGYSIRSYTETSKLADNMDSGTQRDGKKSRGRQTAPPTDVIAVRF